MGCYCSQLSSQVISGNSEIFVAVQSGDLQFFVKKLQDKNSKPIKARGPCELSQALIVYNQIRTDPLGFALMKNKVCIFDFLLNQYGMNVTQMEKQFRSQGFSGMSLICQKGHIQMFTYYLPIHKTIKQMLENQQINPPSSKLSISSLIRVDNFPQVYSSPLLEAISSGNTELVKFIIDLWSDQQEQLPEFDVNWKDPYTGENAALIAIRTNNLELVKWLFFETDANFHEKNIRDENAINIVAVWSKKADFEDYYPIMQFLVNTVKVDVTHRYEETVLSCESVQILVLLYSKLHEKGIRVSKLELECKNQIVKHYVSLEDSSFVTKKHFKFIDAFQELYEDHERVSSISNIQSSFCTDNTSKEITNMLNS